MLLTVHSEANIQQFSTMHLYILIYIQVSQLKVYLILADRSQNYRRISKLILI